MYSNSFFIYIQKTHNRPTQLSGFVLMGCFLTAKFGVESVGIRLTPSTCFESVRDEECYVYIQIGQSLETERIKGISLRVCSELGLRSQNDQTRMTFFQTMHGERVSPLMATHLIS